MNDTTPLPGPAAEDTPQASAGGQSGQANSNSNSNSNSNTHDSSGFRSSTAGRTSDRFFACLRGFGVTRSSDRWLAGVAGGIAEKAHIDPVIVRGVFVVLAVLGGPGILLYLAGWLLLPDASGRIHLEELFRGRSSAGAIAAAVVLGAILIIPTLVWGMRALVTGPWAWSSWNFLPDWLQLTLGILWWAVIVPVLVVWLIVWLSGRANRREAGPAPAGEPAASFSEQAHRYADQASEFAERTGERATEWSKEFGQKAEAWGRTAEEKSQAWAAHSRQHRAARRLDSTHLVITLALTCLAAGIAAATTFSLGAGGDLVFTVALITGVSVLAISTIIAGLRGRESGWVGFLAFCGVVALFFAPVSTVLPAQTEVVPFGQATIHPGNSGGDRAIVSLAGNSTVDLSDLDRTATPRRIEVWLLGGNTTVHLPRSAPTRVKISLLAGNIRDERATGDERRQGGALLSRTIEQPSSGAQQAPLVEVRVQQLGGNVTVTNHRGSVSAAEDRTAELDQLKQRIAELEQAR